MIKDWKCRMETVLGLVLNLCPLRTKFQSQEKTFPRWIIELTVGQGRFPTQGLKYIETNYTWIFSGVKNFKTLPNFETFRERKSLLMFSHPNYRDPPPPFKKEQSFVIIDISEPFNIPGVSIIMGGCSFYFLLCA